ncbi:MAG: flagellar motor protein MotA [Pseudomonadota bacterium]|nr:flagellar motor protein MotA [Pseudomonadota bacterium]
MDNTTRFLFRMLLFLVATSVVGAFLFNTLYDAFLTNLLLNSLIFAVLLIGIFLNFRQVFVLRSESNWLKSFQLKSKTDGSLKSNSDTKDQFEPSLLLPMSKMLSESQNKSGKFSLTTQAMRTLLDGIISRLDESREVARYFIGLSIFLGLLGTFWGLLETVASIGEVIRNLSITGDDITIIFNTLKSGLEKPLDGMGTAFSSSLFGLGGSLILGFLDLQAGQAQNSFYNHLEEWLSGMTKLSSTNDSRDGEQNISAYTEALLEQTAESLEELQRIIGKSEESRIYANNQFAKMNENLSLLTDQMKTEQQVLLKMANNQKDLFPILDKMSSLATALENNPDIGIDQLTKVSIRNIDQVLGRLVSELGSRHEQLVKDLRSDIKILAKTIAASGDRNDNKDI